MLPVTLRKENDTLNLFPFHMAHISDLARDLASKHPRPLAPPAKAPGYLTLLNFARTSMDPDACQLVGCHLLNTVFEELRGLKGGRGTLVRWTNKQCMRCKRIDYTSGKYLPPHENLEMFDLSDPAVWEVDL